MKLLVCLAASAAILAAEPWNMFRGPNGTGVADSRDLPVELEASLLWKTAIPPGHSSPVAADGKLSAVSMNGNVRVVKADAEWSVIGSRDLKQEVWATPAIAGDRIYIRTVEGLYCFGKKKGVV